MPFNPASSRSTRDNGALPEFLRTTPGALRCANPGASIAAIGRAGELAHLNLSLIVDEFLSTGQGTTGPFGSAPSTLVDAVPIVEFAVHWLERNGPTPR